MPLLEAGPAGTRSAKASSVSKQGGRGFLMDLGRVWRQAGLEKTSPVAVVQAAPRVHRKCRGFACPTHSNLVLKCAQALEASMKDFRWL